jgi:hypothetical protein
MSDSVYEIIMQIIGIFSLFILGLIVIYIVFRLIAKATFKSWYEEIRRKDDEE